MEKFTDKEAKLVEQVNKLQRRVADYESADVPKVEQDVNRSAASRYNEFRNGILQVARFEDFINDCMRRLCDNDTPEVRTELTSLEIQRDELNEKFQCMHSEVAAYLKEARILDSVTKSLQSAGLMTDMDKFNAAAYRACVRHCLSRLTTPIQQASAERQSSGVKGDTAYSNGEKTGTTRQEDAAYLNFKKTGTTGRENMNVKGERKSSESTSSSDDEEPPEDVPAGDGGRAGWSDDPARADKIWGKQTGEASNFDMRGQAPPSYSKHYGPTLGEWRSDPSEQGHAAGRWDKSVARSLHHIGNKYLEGKSRPKYDRESCKVDWEQGKRVTITVIRGGVEHGFSFATVRDYDLFTQSIALWFKTVLPYEAVGTTIWKEILRAATEAASSYCALKEEPSKRRNLAPVCTFSEQEAVIAEQVNHFLLQRCPSVAIDRATEMCDMRKFQVQGEACVPEFVNALMWLRIWCSPNTEEDINICKEKFCETKAIHWTPSKLTMSQTLVRWMAEVQVLERINVLTENDNYEPFNRLLNDGLSRTPDFGLGHTFIHKLIKYYESYKAPAKTTREDFYQNYENILCLYEKFSGPGKRRMKTLGLGENGSAVRRQESGNGNDVRRGGSQDRGRRSGSQDSRRSYGSQGRDRKNDDRGRERRYDDRTRRYDRNDRSRHDDRRGDDRGRRDERRNDDRRDRDESREARLERARTRDRLEREANRRFAPRENSRTRGGSSDSRRSHKSNSSHRERNDERDKRRGDDSRGRSERRTYNVATNDGDEESHLTGNGDRAAGLLEGADDDGGLKEASSKGGGVTSGNAASLSGMPRKVYPGSDEDYVLGPDEFCMQYDARFYIFDRATWESFPGDPDVETWPSLCPKYNPEGLCMNFSVRRGCMDPDCGCIKGTRCANVGKGLMCDYKKCDKREGHTHFACFVKHPELKKVGRFAAKKKLTKRPKSREPSLDRSGQPKSSVGRKDF